MKIALDYDETFTADRQLFTNFVNNAKQNHLISFVTIRHIDSDNSDIINDGSLLGIDVIFTNGKQKRHCYEADIWIDDSPEVIPTTDELINMHVAAVKYKEPSDNRYINCIQQLNTIIKEAERELKLNHKNDVDFVKRANLVIDTLKGEHR